MASLVRGDFSHPFAVDDASGTPFQTNPLAESPERGKQPSPDCRTLLAPGIRPLLWARYEREARTRSVVQPPQNGHLGSRGRASQEARQRGSPAAIIPGMRGLLEAVPNFSVGRDRAVLAAIRTAIEGHARVLDVHADADHNRSVFTCV